MSRRKRGTARLPLCSCLIEKAVGDPADKPTHRRPLIGQENLSKTPGASSVVFARTTGITHQTINVRRGVRVVSGVFHIQYVNAYDSRLKGWMRRFHGVATQYLENYLGWRRLIERYANTISPSACLAEAADRPINS